jgi:hypothetical protein
VIVPSPIDFGNDSDDLALQGERKISRDALSRLYHAHVVESYRHKLECSDWRGDVCESRQRPSDGEDGVDWFLGIANEICAPYYAGGYAGGTAEKTPRMSIITALTTHGTTT